MKNDFLKKRLNARKECGLFRKLTSENNLIDFSSNDYLGFARSEELKKNINSEIESLRLFDKQGEYLFKNGATGSRLLTGNTLYAEALERFIAEFHKAEAGLIFNSGYAANMGLISSVGQRGDVILYDEFSHASIYDGVRLSKAESFPFRHNDVGHLEERLTYFQNNRNGDSTCFVVVESVYSMDGDFAPLKAILELCEKYNVNLIVDEAHATGIYGPKGEGKIVELGIEKNVFARVHTFGKALGCHGAIVLGSHELISYLINFARTFIYTTALPLGALVSIKSAYKLLDNLNNNLLKISKLINLFKLKVNQMGVHGFVDSSSPIQSLIIKGNDTVKKVANRIQNDGFDVRPILSPTVPKGKERIRICLHTFNTESQINALVSSLHKNIKFVSEIHFV